MSPAEWVMMAALIALAIYAQYQKVVAERLAEALVEAHVWVDEIIEALEDPDVDQGNACLDRLVAVHPGSSAPRDGS